MQSVEALEREGLVERAADPGDGRSQLVRLTPETRSVGRGSRARSAEGGGPPDRLWFARAPEVTLLEGVTRVRRYAENVAEVLLNGLSLSNRRVPLPCREGVGPRRRRLSRRRPNRPRGRWRSR